MEAANPYSAPTAGLESGMKKCESCGAGIKQLLIDRFRNADRRGRLE